MLAAINLADLYRRLQRENDAENVLRAAIAVTALDAGVHHALGLTLVRLKRLNEALGELRRAAEPGTRTGEIRLCLRRGIAFRRTRQ